MIYLIGGAPRCGKTILSKKIAVKKRISWISTDTIRSMVLASTAKSLVSKKFPFEKLQKGGPYADLESTAPHTLLRAEITESRSIWPSVRSMIEKLIESQEDFVIEGVHLLPALVAQLKTTPYWKQLRPVYLVKCDLAEIEEGFSRNASRHDWLASALTNESLRNKAARYVQTESLFLSKEAKKYGFLCVDTGKEFQKKLTTAAESVRT